MKLIVGLGNPGPRYADTRHNVGFRVITQLAKEHNIKVTGSLGPAIVGEGQIGGQPVLLLQPTTFMNRSGPAVTYAMRQRQIALEDILLIYDDLDLPLGKIRLRAKGSSGGHNGMRSVIAALGTQEFARLRVGIGRSNQSDVIDYVLEPFSREEIPIIMQVVETASEAVAVWVSHGIAQAASQFNGL